MADTQAIVNEELFTADFFLKWLPEDFKADLIDGEIAMASPASSRHETLQGWLMTTIFGYVEVRRLGRVYGAEMTYELDELNAFEPDISFLSAQNLARDRETKVVGPPDVAIEIVSRSSRATDYGRKKDAYERFGTSEYWLFDYRQARVEFFRLIGGKYQMLPLENSSVFRSEAIPGFWLDIHWVLADPRPPAYECLRKVLGD
jgi:Uma2 family endonuclease